MSNYKCMVFVSGNGSNLKNIIQKIDSGFISNVTIEAVVSDNRNAKGLGFAEEKNIETFILDSSFNYEDLSNEIIKNNINLLVLAGFMKILPEKFINTHDGKIINLHPSLLPKYKGLETHKRVLEAREMYHGASVHFATKELDDGPVFIQGILQIDSKDDEKTLEEKVHNIEYEILPLAIKWFSENKIKKEGTHFSFEGIIKKDPIVFL